MKGLCIDASELDAPVLKEGEIYILEHCPRKYDKPAYHLPEIKALYPDKKCDFLQLRFVLISDKDETEYSDEILEKIFVPLEKH